MGRRSRMSVQKRKRERDKAERAAMKREERTLKEPKAEGGGEPPIATDADLEGYGLVTEPDDDDSGRG